MTPNESSSGETEDSSADSKNESPPEDNHYAISSTCTRYPEHLKTNVDISTVPISDDAVNIDREVLFKRTESEDSLTVGVGDVILSLDDDEYEPLLVVDTPSLMRMVTLNLVTERYSEFDCKTLEEELEAVDLTEDKPLPFKICHDPFGLR